MSTWQIIFEIIVPLSFFISAGHRHADSGLEGRGDDGGLLAVERSYSNPAQRRRADEGEHYYESAHAHGP